MKMALRGACIAGATEPEAFLHAVSYILDRKHLRVVSLVVLPRKKPNRRKQRGLRVAMTYHGNRVRAETEVIQRRGLRPCLAIAILSLLLASTVSTATTYVLPTDEELVITSDAVVLGTIVEIRSIQSAPFRIETQITLRVEKSYKGARNASRVVLRQEGGVVGGRGHWIWGSPRFRIGERALVFLKADREDRLTTHMLGLGKFRVTRSPEGRDIVERDLEEPGVRVLSGAVQNVAGRRRLSELEQLIDRTVAVHGNPLLPSTMFQEEELVASSGTSQVEEEFTLLGLPARWFEPDSGTAVGFLADFTGQLGISGGGFTEFDRALIAWSSVPSSTLNLTNAGKATPSPFEESDGRNLVVFNDPFDEIADPTSCSGVLAKGGFWFDTSERRIVNQMEFSRITEGDVVFANGFEACRFWTEETFAEILAHELGHTVGLGHSSSSGSEADCSLSEALMYFAVHADGRGASASTLLRDDDRIGVSFAYPASRPMRIYVLDDWGGVHASGAADSLAPAGPYFGFDMAADMEPTTDGNGYYVLDRFGAVHVAGAAPVIQPSTPYFGFDIAGDMALLQNGTGYYVLDRFGGVHRGGTAPPVLPVTPYFGMDIARRIKLGSGETGYYVLDGFGGVHTGGSVPALTFQPSTPYFGFDVAADLEVAPDGRGYYVLDRLGGLHRAGCPPILRPPPPYFGFDIAADLALLPDGTGGFVLDRLGGVHRLGTASDQTPASPYFGFYVARTIEVVP